MKIAIMKQKNIDLKMSFALMLHQHTKVPVYFSQEISDKIDSIKAYNESNLNGKSQWKTYLKRIVNYISNRSIAWDYSGKYIHMPNGTVLLRELGYEVDYIIQTDENNACVCIINMKLNNEEYGLKDPTTECKQNGRIDRIITEAINNFLRREFMK